MKKISCDVIRDLLPLYCDEICSPDTAKLVEEHLKDCQDCSDELDKLKLPSHSFCPEIAPPDDVMKNMAAAWKKSKAKSFSKGLLIAFLICFLLVGGYWSATRLIFIPIPAESVTASVESLTDERITVSYRTEFENLIRYSDLRITDEGKCYFILKQGLLPEKDKTGTERTGSFSLPLTAISDSGKSVALSGIYCGPPEDCTVIWEKTT